MWIPAHKSYQPEVKEWIEENCTGSWRSSWVPGSSRSGDRMFMFELERDALWFQLRWQ